MVNAYKKGINLPDYQHPAIRKLILLYDLPHPLSDPLYTHFQENIGKGCAVLEREKQDITYTLQQGSLNAVICGCTFLSTVVSCMHIRQLLTVRLIMLAEGHRLTTCLEKGI